jgi:Zn-dependent protease with chaperone function
MDISWFFNSYPGMFIAQSFSHSLIAAIIVGRAIKAWRITDPILKQKFLFLVVIIPLFSFPAYQLINPARKSIAFRLGALFDMNRWLNLEILGKISLSVLFIIMLSITALVFFFQEALPIIRHTFTSPKPDFHAKNPAPDSIVLGALEKLPGEKPEIFILDDDDILLFSTTGKNASIYLSRGLTNSLNIEQLQAAISHEIAHVTRNRKPHLLIVFLFRILLFFNPVVLVEFRRVVQEEEKICDDIAVSITQNPSVLAETLRKLYLIDSIRDEPRIKDLSKVSSTVEDRSHKMLIRSRITRLEGDRGQKIDRFRLKMLITAALVIGINYFVV